MLPGGAPVAAIELSGRPQPYFRGVAQIGLQAAQGLAYAHARGVVHRDIKPSNLMLDTAGVVWITNFGLAKAEDDHLTATGDPEIMNRAEWNVASGPRGSLSR